VNEVTVGSRFFREMDAKIHNNTNFYDHFTDMLSVGLVWKYGGIFGELSTIFIKPIDFVEAIPAITVRAQECPRDERAVECSPPRSQPIAGLKAFGNSLLCAANLYITNTFFAAKQYSPFLKYLFELADGWSYIPNIKNQCSEKLFSVGYAHVQPEDALPLVPYEIVSGHTYRQSNLLWRAASEESWNHLLSQYYAVQLEHDDIYLFNQYRKYNTSDILVLKLLNKFCVLCDDLSVGDNYDYQDSYWDMKNPMGSTGKRPIYSGNWLVLVVLLCIPHFSL